MKILYVKFESEYIRILFSNDKPQRQGADEEATQRYGGLSPLFSVLFILQLTLLLEQKHLLHLTFQNLSPLSLQKLQKNLTHVDKLD